VVGWAWEKGWGVHERRSVPSKAQGIIRLMGNGPPNLAIGGGPPVRDEFLHFHRASLGPEEEQAVVEVLRSGWLTTGARARELEARFADYTGAPHAIAVSSCTAALHLSLVGLGVGPGDEVITTPITWAATANVIVHTGATPVFADVLPGDLCIDPADVARRVTPRTRAVIPVHYAGMPCDIDALAAAVGPDVPIIEDAAHAVETIYKGRKVGGISRTSCFSFYATKNITTAEGGMVTTADDELAERMRCLALHGISRDAWKRYTSSGFKRYQVVEAGYKYNLSDLQAALGVCQMDRLEAMHQARRELVARYRELLAPVEGISPLSQEEAPGSRNAFHLLPVLVDDAHQRDWIMAAIQAENVGVGIHFPALHLEPYYQQRYGFQAGACPVAEDAAARTLSLPLFPSMTEAEQDDVVAAVAKVMGARDQAPQATSA
jgi:dTDP-4-amino-4,6-dideoxygalactose transaminase